MFLLSLAGLIYFAPAASAQSAGNTIDLSDDTITEGASGTGWEYKTALMGTLKYYEVTGNVTITGNNGASGRYIWVASNGAAVTITLDSVTISGSNSVPLAIDNSNVTLILSGVNTLTGTTRAGISGQNGSTLNIQGSGTLNVIGANNITGSGIVCDGSVTIENGTVDVTSSGTGYGIEAGAISVNYTGATGTPSVKAKGGTGVAAFSTPPTLTGVGSYQIAGGNRLNTPFTYTNENEITFFKVPAASAPMPGDNGKLTAESVTDRTFTLKWTKADDIQTPQANLKYYVYKSSIDISSVGDWERAELLNTGGTLDIEQYDVTGLYPSDTMYFNVLVEDEDGDRAVYNRIAVTTLSPTTPEQPSQPPSGNGANGGGGSTSGGTNPDMTPFYGVSGSDPKPEQTDPKDAPSDWAAAAVKKAIELKLIPARLQGGWSADLSRADFCALAVKLYEYLDGKPIEARGYFDDTTDVNVQKLAGLGIVTGGGNGKFDPDGVFTREMALTLMYNMMVQLGHAFEPAEPSFADADTISPWAKAAIGALQKAGVVSDDGQYFNPSQVFTREMGVVTVMNFLQ